jgi:Flp pilus assembly protein TadG
MFTNNRIREEKSGNAGRALLFRGRRRVHRRERGATLLLAALSMFMILAVAGLAIDLAALYVGRSEAQRAADAAALAGAKVFVSSGFTSGLVSQAVVQTLAAQQAAAVGNMNRVGGLNPAIASTGFSASCPPAADGDGCFDFAHSNDPRITVVVQRTAARGDGMPTFFMRLFGIQTVDVSAEATAEAYNPSGGSGPGVGAACVKPWLMPNCDPHHTVAVGDPRGNPKCPVTGGLAAYYVDPTTRNIVYPGPTSSGGAIGELVVIKPGSPSAAAAPSQFYPVFLPPEPNGFPAQCPSCGAYPGGSGPNSGALYRANIACCNLTPVVGGQTQIQPITGDMTGPTALGVDCLINENYGAGMDVLDTSVYPFRILAGSNNPLVLSHTIAANAPISSSDSIVTAPIYDGTTLCPGGSCPSTETVNVLGLMQLFVKDETSPQGTVEAYILNISGTPGSAGAGGSGGSSSGTITTGDASPIPVRLIHN